MDTREKKRNLIAFWALGFLNNVVYVANNASADDIAPGNYGLIYLCSVGWSMLVKMTGPYWFHYVSYKERIFFGGICCILDFCLVNFGTSMGVKLLGVSLGSVQSGLGEATILALAAFYQEPATCLVMWSSGTGFAGPGGYILSMYVFAHVDTLYATLLGSFLAVLYLLAFFLLLEPPWIDNVRGGVNKKLTLQPVPLVTQEYGEESRNASTVGQRVSMESPSIIKEVFSDSEISIRESLIKKPPSDDIPITDQLTYAERFKFIASLWPYMTPLFLVYYSEYCIQAGAWSTVAFDPSQISDRESRKNAYQNLNLLYQCGVFVSRSSGSYLKANLCTLWTMPLLQCGFLIFFIINAAGNNIWVGKSLMAPAFCVGLLGGAVYVNAYCMLTRKLPKKFHELALSSASQADSIGIMLANITSLYIQWCLFKANGIADPAGGRCPG